ncbi:PAAR domain-containing protein [Burkholderia pyrrocinia]|nr:PAAR domain-containing protein [Burkholderia pyrrocinia]
MDVRLHVDNTHGGKVIHVSCAYEIMSRQVARKGDRVSRPEHGENEIIEGDDMLVIDGISVALHGHRCACGCTLISSLPDYGKD